MWRGHAVKGILHLSNACADEVLATGQARGRCSDMGLRPIGQHHKQSEPDRDTAAPPLSEWLDEVVRLIAEIGTGPASIDTPALDLP
jgi:hypothetical protein